MYKQVRYFFLHKVGFRVLVVCIYIDTHTHTHVYIYVYIYIERERTFVKWLRKKRLSPMLPYIKYILCGRQSHSLFSIICELCLLKHLITFSVFVQHELSFFLFLHLCNFACHYFCQVIL